MPPLTLWPTVYILCVRNESSCLRSPQLTDMIHRAKLTYEITTGAQLRNNADLERFHLVHGNKGLVRSNRPIRKWGTTSIYASHVPRSWQR